MDCSRQDASAASASSQPVDVGRVSMEPCCEQQERIGAVRGVSGHTRSRIIWSLSIPKGHTTR